jgi:hypothetical protein
MAIVNFADFIARHLAERFAIPAHGTEQNHEVLHRAAEHCAEQDPKRPRQIAELRGERGAHQRPRSGNCSEVMAEQYPLIRRFEIMAVAEPFGGRGPSIIEQHDFGRDELCVETEANQENGCRRRNQP